MGIPDQFLSLQTTQLLNSDGTPVSENNPLPTRVITSFKVTWRTATDFNSGTNSSTQVSGSGEAAVVELAELDDTTGSFPFDTTTSYVLSDSGKIEVAGGNLRLKTISGNSQEYEYSTSSNYTFDSAKVEFTNGAAQLADVFPGTFYASYAIGFDGDEGGGNLTGTTSGSPTITSGKLDLRGGTKKNVSYDAVGNADSAQTGAIRFKLTPNYNTKPSTWQAFFVITAAHNDLKNRIEFRQSSSAGQLQFRINDQNGTSIGVFTLANWSTTAFQEYEMEFNYDFTGGISRLYIDGVQHGATMSTVGIRNSASITLLAVGRDYNDNETANFQVRDFAVFDTVQHTANYSVSGSPPWNNFPTDNPTVITNDAFSFTTNLSTFSETSTTPTSTSIKHAISADSGSTYFYWNASSSAWITSTSVFTEANSAGVINTNISSFTSSGVFVLQSFLHSSDAAVTPQLSNVTVAEQQTFSTDDDIYAETNTQSSLFHSSILQWFELSISSSIPSNTDGRILFSNNQRSSWLTFDGSGWTTPTSDTTRTDATSFSDAVANFSSFPVNSQTMDIRIFLKTDTVTTRPFVSDVTVVSESGRAISGNWMSGFVESTFADLVWGKTEFTTNVLTGTSVTIQAQSHNTTTSFTTTGFGASITSGDNASTTGKLIQFNVEFSGTALTTPSLSELSVEYQSPATQVVSP